MASNEPRRSLRSNNEVAENAPTSSQPQPIAEGSSRQFPKRGKAVNQKKYKIKEYNGGIIPIKFNDDYSKPVEEHSDLWERELGIIARDYIPLCYNNWLKIPKSHKQFLYCKIKDEFGVDCVNNSKAKECADNSLAIAHRKYRYRLKEYFNQFETEETARRNTHPEVSHEDWQILCNRWMSKKFQEISAQNKENRSKNDVIHYAGSKSFAKMHYEEKQKEATINDEDSDEENEDHIVGPAIKMYKNAHFKEGTGWVNDDARKAYDNMVAQSKESINVDTSSSIPVDEQILENCLGKGKGTYFRGFGHGKKAPPRGHKRDATIAELVAELEAERRRANRAEEKCDGMMESINDLKATVASLAENQNRMSSQLMFTQFGGHRHSFGSQQQQQQQSTYGPFGSLLNSPQRPMFGAFGHPYQPFQSEPDSQ